MKIAFFFLLLVVGWTRVLAADDRIYRCGNEYTNAVSDAQAKNCKLISGGNVTVIQAVKPSATKPGASAPRTDSADQRAKESDARLILEAELKRAEAKLAELLKEYNNGEPEKLAPETRNHQKYLDRIAELQSAISRSQGDIAGIKRELSRVAPQSPNAGATGSGGNSGKAGPDTATVKP